MKTGKQAAEKAAEPDVQEAAAVWVNIADLKPWQHNPRINDHAVEDVARAIKRFGWTAPIVARKADGEVIAGHTRLKAALALGMTRVPVRYMDLDPSEAHLAALADNKLGEIADWDQEALNALMADFTLAQADAAGWSPKELAAVVNFGDERGGRASALRGSYSIVVECDDEGQQAELLQKFEDLGLRCKALMT